MQRVTEGLLETESRSLEASDSKHLGELAKLRKDIELQVWAVSLTPNGHPDRPVSLSDLGDSYHSLFERLGELPDLNKAIEFQAQAVSLTSDSHPGKPLYLNNLGLSLHNRFECLGELSDLQKATEFWHQAVSLTPDGHPSRPIRLSSLGSSYYSRFTRLGELLDLEKAVELQAQAVSLTPDDHTGKSLCLNNLGLSYRSRFERLGELPDLNNAIELQLQAASLVPDDQLDKPLYLNNLGLSYYTRFERLGKLLDLKKAIEFQAWAVSLAPDDYPDKPLYLNNLGLSYRSRFERLDEAQDLHKAIECQEQAVLLTSDGNVSKPFYLNNLGLSYYSRFQSLGELSDLQQALEFQVQAVSLTPDDHPHKPVHLSNLGISHHSRFERLGELLDLNKAIEFQAQAVLLTPDDHPGKSLFLNNLGLSYHSRFERLSKLSDLQKAIEFWLQAVSLIPDGHPGKPERLSNLGFSYYSRFKRLSELPDLNKAIEFQAQAISLTPDGRPDKPLYLNNLGLSYYSHYTRLGELSDLNKAIEFQAQAVSLTPDGHPKQPLYLTNLGLFYHSRSKQLDEISDMQLAISSFKRAAHSLAGSPSVRFCACRQWASLSLFDTTSPPHSAYDSAMQLLPQLLWIGSTLDRRYELIREVGDFASEAASHAISFAAYDLALERLEAGRSIVWGQIINLRTPFDQLATHDPELANQLQQVGCKLEQASTRLVTFTSAQSDGHELVNEANCHAQLALTWDKLLAKARSLPGFDDFLRPPKSSRLLDTAHNGPIAIINTHQSRCDALILRPNTDTISHIPLTAFSEDITILACEHLVSLVGQRGFKKVGGKSGSNANRPSSLEESLKTLWLSVVKPVLEHLQLMNKPQGKTLPRITWCTTGSLSFLPLHAAGCYDKPGSSTFDYVVSSYTPTLSALLSNRSRPANIPCGIVAIGQEHTPGFCSLPYVSDELKNVKHHVRASEYLQLASDEATIDRVLDGMGQFSWVHMACHGTQSTADPTQSAFHLHDGPLTLATITKQSFTDKGLAFLSACQTATGDERMPDEAVHLAAGMLMAGYPSVIGTMWSIADEDGPVVADRVYAELLKDGVMDHTKSAWALHQAVGELRAKVGAKNIERWAPFIHIGS